MTAARTEVAVVGSGLVGMVTSLLLAAAGREVTLIGALAYPAAADEPWDLRSFALTPASRRILEHCGVWAALDATRIARFEGMAVRDAASGAQIEFEAGDARHPPLAYLVEHANLFAACQQQLAGQRRLADLSAEICAVESGASDVCLELGARRTLHAQAVIACDGRDSRLRAQCGFVVDEHDFGQSAIVANVRTRVPHGGIARQRFLPGGPLAFLPLPSPTEVAIVWSTTPAQAEWALACPDHEFRVALTEAFGGWLGEVETTSRRLSFPLVQRHARTYAQGRFALAGDAAHVIHPLAGQGLNLGLLDAAALAETLGLASPAAMAHPQSLLARYARRRRGGNLAMLTVTGQLNRLFAREELPIVALRRLGLTLVDRWRPCKRWLMSEAMGQRRDLPLLARPGAAT